jgi:hypothetical protein
MDNITVDMLKELAREKEPSCISIFLPTNRAGLEVNEMVDQKHLKYQVKEVRDKLKSLEIKNGEIEKLLKPVTGLIDDGGFWKHQSDGLAIFRNLKRFDFYTLPVPFEPFTLVADHFYPMPLIPYINEDCKFYMLALSLNYVRIYECYPYQLTELEIEDLVPEKLEEAVGYDYQEKNLQFRMGQTGFGRSMFHGQGNTNEEAKKLEILKFFRAVNDGLMKLLHDKQVPLILAAVDYLVPIYREANDYNNLQKNFIPGNPEHEDPVMLHEKARAILADCIDRGKSEKTKAFEQALSRQKASYKEEEIIQAAVDQRIDTLYIKNREEMWGTYEADTAKIIEQTRESGQGACLLNMAAMYTIQNNGKVYLLDHDEMPVPDSRLNAIFRY